MTEIRIAIKRAQAKKNYLAHGLPISLESVNVKKMLTEKIMTDLLLGKVSWTIICYATAWRRENLADRPSCVKCVSINKTRAFTLNQPGAKCKTMEIIPHL